MDRCRNYHELNEENVRYVKSKSGKLIKRCKKCDSISKLRYEEKKNSSTDKCSIEECTNYSKYRGLCETHRKMNNKGQELKRLLIQDTLLQRIKDRVIIDSNGCWVWQNRLIKGYGYFTYKGKRMLTHRGAFEEFYNTKLSRKDVLDHLCMNKACCNPEHLERVTQRENSKRSQAFYSLDEKYGRLVVFLQQQGLSLVEIEAIANGEEVAEKVVVS